MAAVARPTAATYARSRRIIPWLCAAVAMLPALLIAAEVRDDALMALPYIGLALLVAASAAIFRWPFVGPSIVIFGVALFEPLPVPGDETTRYTWIFHANLQSWSPVPLPLSTIEVLLIISALAWLLRAGHRGRLVPPMGTLGRPVLAFAGLISLGFLVGVILSAGDSRVALWEVRALAYVVLSYFMVGSLLRSRGQITALGWLLTIGLTLNALRLIWRANTLSPALLAADAENAVSGLAHENALFLVLLVVYCLAQFAFGRWNGLRWVLVLSLPIVFTGVLVSQRRAAFAVLMLGALAWALFLYRLRRRAFWLVIPPLALVLTAAIGAGWNSPGPVGQPARALKTVLGMEISDRDASSDLYRIMEEYNIWKTIRSSPLLGVGFGKPFNQYVSLPSLSGWEFQLYTPHNQVFWLWLKMGVFGFIVTLWLFASGIGHAARLIVHIDDPVIRPFLVMALAYVIMLLAFSYVDVGLANGRAMLMLGSLLAVIGHLPRVLGLPAEAPVPAPERAAPRPRFSLRRRSEVAA